MMSNNLIHVSNQGQYKFVLKVTDADGKSDEDDVKVYVKPPTNLPPVAVAGPDMELSLPLYNGERPFAHCHTFET